MRIQKVQPTGREQFFGENEIIVSKTDARGIITYANHTFQQVSGYTEKELLGQPHNIIRHPDMPQCVFRVLWDTIRAGKEIFAFVINQCKDGGHYWVLAHVTPTFDASGKIAGYHSNRRVPDRQAIDRIQPVYAALLAEERRHPNSELGIKAALEMLGKYLADLGMEYDEFVFSLIPEEVECSR
ncbi:MAG: PAS domain-containing protein [Bryobacterales bacterium]|nr:PAS domain-containing protein [Bryobacterales bacterium]